ncbi:hypothetical protein ABKN59_008863 [Abortiporus biennis]
MSRYKAYSVAPQIWQHIIPGSTEARGLWITSGGCCWSVLPPKTMSKRIHILGVMYLSTSSTPSKDPEPTAITKGVRWPHSRFYSNVRSSWNPVVVTCAIRKGKEETSTFNLSVLNLRRCLYLSRTSVIFPEKHR